MLSRVAIAAVLLSILSTSLPAQDMPGKKAPSVTMETPAIATVMRGKIGSTELQFRVGAGFHINSNKPSADYLIPTTLRLDAPTDLVVGKITYPPGQESSFAFAPDEKLSVYSGDFDLTVQIRALSSVLPGKYEFRGELKYQACDNAACYPPKKLPVQFEVKVIKAPPPHHAPPPQSPHTHS